MKPDTEVGASIHLIFFSLVERLDRELGKAKGKITFNTNLNCSTILAAPLLLTVQTLYQGTFMLKTQL